MENCNICDEKYNNTQRKKISCRCNFHACRKCVKTYILSKMENSHCMSCKIAFDRKFMNDNFDRKFMTTEYRVHRENILLEKELGMLQATQVYVERDIEIENTELELKENTDLLSDIYTKINQNKNKLSFLKNNKIPEKREFIRRCPKNDCLGFLSTSLKCKICEYYSCGECKELKGKTTDEKNEHICDMQIIESVRMLEKDSKNCPKCSALIFKINGCFAKDTPILMYDGSTKMSQDILVGDILVGDNGEKRVVQNLVSGEDEMYEVKQANGENYIVNSKHTLVLKFCGDKSIYWYETEKRWKLRWFCRETKTAKTKDFVVKTNISKEQAKQSANNFRDNLIFTEEIEMTIEEYMKIDKWSKKALMGFKSSHGVKWGHRNVNLDPYLLGLWLGDGTHTHPVIASEDIEIQQYILKWCEENNAELLHDEGVKFRIRRRGLKNGKSEDRFAISKGCTSNICKGCVSGRPSIVRRFDFCSTPTIENKDKFSGIRTNPFMDLLKQYNLLGDKHIPKEYLINDRETRLKVLAGLIDTDGHVSKEQKGKRISIGLKNKKLFDDMVFLTRSLGFVVNIRVVEHKNQEKFGYQAKDYPDEYVLNISGELLHEIPTILPRKRCLGTLSNKDYFRTSINVSSKGKGNYFGWSVDKNRRFVSPDFTVFRNCNSMYCIECHCSFNWVSLKIEKGPIHNPEYFDMLKQKGFVPRDPNDIQCGRELDMNLLHDLMVKFNISRQTRLIVNHQYRNANTYNKKTKEPIIEIVRKVIEIKQVYQPTFLNRAILDENLAVRISYMRNFIDREKFKRILQRKEKDIQKKDEIYNIISLFISSMTEIFYRILAEKDEKYNDHILEMNNLRIYINECLDVVSKVYNCKKYLIDSSYDFI